jgi:hypothetical protein
MPLDIIDNREEKLVDEEALAWELAQRGLTLEH